MSIEEKLKKLILDKYKSVRAFTKEIDVPYSTIDTMFKRGIGGTAVTTVIKMCKALNIDTDALTNNEIKERRELVNIDITLSEEKRLKKYRKLDEHGGNIVNTVLDMEYNRCKPKEEYNFAAHDDGLEPEEAKGRIDKAKAIFKQMDEE